MEEGRTGIEPSKQCADVKEADSLFAELETLEWLQWKIKANNLSRLS